jgi:hypothetical protein
MVLGKLDRHTQKNETRFLPVTVYKINSKWIKDLNVRPQSMKLLEEKSQGNTSRHWYKQRFWGKTPKIQATKRQLDKWDYIKLRIFYVAKETELRVNQRNGTKYLQSIYPKEVNNQNI